VPSFDSVLSELSARAAELQSAVDRWNAWYIAALVAAALIAAAVVYTNRGVIIRQGKLAQTQEAIIRAKDQQLRTELAKKDAARDAESRDKDLKIAEAAGVAAAANERTAKLELDAAAQRERAAKAEKSLLELQQQLAPREFTKEEFHNIVRVLTDGPKGHVDIVHTSDSETQLFAGFFACALQVSGWTFSRSAIPFASGPDPLGQMSNGRGGFTLGLRDGGHQPPRTKTLHDALEIAGFSAMIWPDPSLSEDAVQLSVWPRPLALPPHEPW
jgi:hypothetical protein